MKYIPVRQHYFANNNSTQINRQAVESGLIAVLNVAANGVLVRRTYDEMSRDHTSPVTVQSTNQFGELGRSIAERDFFRGVSDGAESPYQSVRRDFSRDIGSSGVSRFSEDSEEQPRARRRLVF